MFLLKLNARTHYAYLYLPEHGIKNKNIVHTYILEHARDLVFKSNVQMIKIFFSRYIYVL